MPKKIDVPPFYAVLCIFASFALSRMIPVVVFQNPLVQVLGFFIMMNAVVLILFSMIFFHRKNTDIHPHSSPSALVKEGPFRISRNPMYLGMLVITFSVNMIFGALSGFVTVPVLFLVLKTRFVLPEEARLQAAFGAEAEAYLAATRRWI